jgi:hypothetical protein
MLLLFSNLEVFSQTSQGDNTSFTEFRGISISDLFQSRFLKDSTYKYVPSAEVEWRLAEKQVYFYDHLGRVQKEERANFTEGVWYKNVRITNVYQEGSLIASEHEDVWDQFNQSWKVNLKRNYEYTSENLLSVLIESKWENDLWIPNIKKEYAYNYLREPISETTWQRDLIGSDWLPDSRVLFQYNSYNQVKRRTVQQWDDSLQVWVNLQSTSFTYTDGDKLVSTTSLVWDETQMEWIEAKRISIIYDEDGKILGIEEVSLDSVEPLSVSSENAQYDQEGNLNSIILNLWDSEDGEWEEAKKEVHFWSEYYVPTNQGGENEIQCFFSNPYSAGLPWFCESLKTNINYSLEVYDMQGRLHFADQFRGGSVFRIDRELEPGFYTVLIRGGLDVHSEKILIRR